MKRDLANMMCLDIYVTSLPEDKCNSVKEQIQKVTYKPTSLTSWDIHQQHFNKLSNILSVEKDLQEIKKMATLFQWKNDIDSIIKNNDFEALVVTDLSKKIIWVNNGFSKMTGYSKKHILHQRPQFLQGESTSEYSREKIRTKLLKNKPFKEIIVNYKKDKSPYYCELHIFPLYNKETTHFLALEKEVV